MPSNIQARTDNMATQKKSKHKLISSIVILAVLVAVVAIVTFG